MSTKKPSENKQPLAVPAAKPAGFDRGAQDFFRGSRGLQFNNKVSNRTFIGMRRGSR